jgi:hypothetical protein
MRFASLADRAQPAVGGFGGKVLGRRSPEQARIGAAITRKWTRICNHEGPLPMSDKGTATDASRHKDPVGLNACRVGPAAWRRWPAMRRASSRVRRCAAERRGRRSAIPQAAA